MKIKYLYLVLCIFGLILPYSQLVPILIEGNISLQMFFDQLFINRVSSLFAFDLLVTAIVFLIFAISEGIKLKIRYMWFIVLATFLVGASLGFPLFLYFREVSIEKISS